ncbi:MoaD/ThiS family protein [Variovorax sp. J22G21]|uniref:MoaD/ThiS family protein n=1 Tax=Variovorax fucosicus TaxID=3053517 RepID=UPI002575C583|nr:MULTISPECIES: MoaD/ThiS family protein [unclassified Variovorax]MDM0040627.1 MoaD/ThiS family protein [Variovorax sp. J22R193]MDM0062000.1 MoaD/ThiS family protein [Variovorax sp. J22G21]
MKRVRIRYFASVREALGKSDEALDTMAPTLAALRDELIARGEPYAGALARGRAVRMALDQVMSAESAGLEEGSEVAFFPPVTGG